VTKPIRIAIADPNSHFIAQLTDYLWQCTQIQVVGTAADGPGAVEVCAETLPDVIVLNLQLPIVDGVKTTQALLNLSAQLGILVMSEFEADDYALQAIKMGARGFLSKSASLEAIAQAIEQINQGDVCIPSGLASLMLSEFDRLA
jgi:DNA-binding NarL/FixJ family response regulator